MKTVKITEVKPNPKNPRIIKDDKFRKLVKSIQEFPDMLNKRPLIVFTDTDGKYVVLGGNMRLKACKEVGLKEIPIIVADEWTEEQKNEFLIKDNVGFGEWDWDNLANEWESELLNDWGLNVPLFNDDMTNNEDYEGLDQLSKLDKFLNAELKRMFLVYDNETFENVVNWFNNQQDKHELENHSQVILKLMENENL
jgi:ParB-like chromosome segregation protein Spo0J